MRLLDRIKQRQHERELKQKERAWQKRVEADAAFKEHVIEMSITNIQQFEHDRCLSVTPREVLLKLPYNELTDRAFKPHDDYCFYAQSPDLLQRCHHTFGT